MEMSNESQTTPLMSRSASGSEIKKPIRQPERPTESPNFPERRRTLSGAGEQKKFSLCSGDANNLSGMQRKVSVLDRHESRAMSISQASTNQPRQPSISISKSVSGYAKERQFDKKLEEKAKVKMDGKSEKMHKFQKKWLSGLKNVVIVFYFLLIPMLETPDWCLDYFRADR